MTNSAPLGPWVRRFLLEHVVGERNLAINTQKSYRDMLKRLLPYAATEVGKSIDRLTVHDLSAAMIRTFLGYCCISVYFTRISQISSPDIFLIIPLATKSTLALLMVQESLRSRSVKELPSLRSGLLLDPSSAPAQEVTMSNAKVSEPRHHFLAIVHRAEGGGERWKSEQFATRECWK